MAYNDRKNIHELFHAKTGVHEKIASKSNFTYRHIIEVIDKYLTSDMKALDVGCGSGTVALYIANMGNRVVGIDISNNSVEKCKTSAEFLKLQDLATFERMDFPRRSPGRLFDFVLLTEVIEHLDNDNLAIKKIHKLLKPGGILLITTPSSNAPLYRLGFADKFDKSVGHLRRYTISELENKLAKHGFIVLEKKKKEGIIRNFLFINPVAGKSIRFIKFFISDFVTSVDNLTLRLFGESNIYLVARKSK